MKSTWCRVVSVLFAGALLGASLAGTAAGASRSRALERLLEKGMYSEADGRGIQRAFSAAEEADVDDRDALSLVEVCIDGEFEGSQIQRVLSIAAQLSMEGLPIEGYIAKIEEGVSKGVPADRVVQAAERRGLALNKAKLILNSMVLQGFSSDDRDELLPDLAEAIEAGRSPEDATTILSEALEEGESPGSIRRKLFP